MMGTFQYRGATLAYFRHPYNQTARNERAIEIPIARWYLADQLADARILEIGNVLAQYGPINWAVLDARESGAINADVMSWEPPSWFDLIVSISTVEHVGFGRYAYLMAGNSEPKDVVERVRGWLAPGGLFMATVPTAFNPILDQQLRTGKLGADELHSLRRISGKNEWAECTLEEALAMPYGVGPYRWGGGMVVILCRPHRGA